MSQRPSRTFARWPLPSLHERPATMSNVFGCVLRRTVVGDPARGRWALRRPWHGALLVREQKQCRCNPILQLMCTSM